MAIIIDVFSGLRAAMGAGYSMMNDLTIIQTTQVNDSFICLSIAVYSLELIVSNDRYCCKRSINRHFTVESFQVTNSAS